ncbi:MAG TPA: DUF2993 domain-containing protein [Allocoleopsis sp.]
MTTKPNRFISKILSPAVRLFLRSQIEKAEKLEFTIDAGNRDIFAGIIPLVHLSAHKAVYQGLHLTDVNLTAKDISINLKEVIKGKPLKLLNPILLSGQVFLEQSDIKTSLSSSLLSNALIDLLEIIIPDISNNAELSVKDNKIIWEQIDLTDGEFKLGGNYTDLSGNKSAIMLRASLELIASNQLKLTLLDLQLPPNFPGAKTNIFDLDLGTEVNIKEMNINSEQISAQVDLKVLP